MSLMLHRIGLLRPSIDPPAVSLPDTFTVEDWSVASGDAKADVTIHTLPDDGGAAITDIEYRLDGGSWVSSGGTSSFTILGLTNDLEYEVELRAVNSVGAGEVGDPKSVTPVEEGDGAWHPNDLSSPPLVVWDPTISSSLWRDISATTPAGDGDPLGRIDDQSTNANHLLQSTDTKRPMLDIIDGVPWIVPDGVDDGFTFTNVKPAMVAAVYYLPSPTNGANTLFCAAEGNFNNSVVTWGNNPTSGWANDNAGKFNYNTGETRIDGALTGNITQGVAQILTMTPGTAGGQSSEGLGAMCLAEFTGRQWKGRVGRVVLLSAMPDEGEYDNLLAWLAEPYGISL